MREGRLPPARGPNHGFSQAGGFTRSRVRDQGHPLPAGREIQRGGDATSRKLVLGPDNGGWFGDGLTTGGVLTQLLEQGPQRVQFRTKAGPVTGFQLLDSAVVVAQRLPRPIGLGAGERSFGWRPQGRGGRGRGGPGGFLEERCPRPRERLLHDYTVALGSHPPPPPP